jgi:serine/threonine-protein phosphatase PPG1
MRLYGDARVWRELVRSFTYLPLAAVVDRRMFVVHGGLSPGIESLDQLVVLDRFGEPTADGVVADLLWSEVDTGLHDFHKLTVYVCVNVRVCVYVCVCVCVCVCV